MVFYGLITDTFGAIANLHGVIHTFKIYKQSKHCQDFKLFENASYQFVDVNFKIEILWKEI